MHTPYTCTHPILAHTIHMHTPYTCTNIMSLYEAEKVIKVVKEPQVLFKVRWLGYGPEQDTWEIWFHLSKDLKQRWDKEGKRIMIQRFTRSWTTIRCNRFSDLLIFFDVKENALLRFSPLDSTAWFHCDGHSYVCKVKRETNFVEITEPEHWPYLLVEFDLQSYYNVACVDIYQRDSSL